MDIEKVKEEYAKFQADHKGFGVMMVMDESANLVIPADFCTQDEAKTLFDAWKNHKGAVELAFGRFPILKWDDLQFAAKNVTGKGNLVGCKTKSNHYIVAHLVPEVKQNIIQASVALNRWSWNVI